MAEQDLGGRENAGKKGSHEEMPGDAERCRMGSTQMR